MENTLTLFEYISVAFSIVLSLGVASLLGSIRRIFSAYRRYWIHYTWFLIVLFAHAVGWWSLWSFSNYESWSLPAFLLVLLQPGLLFLLALLLVGDSPVSTESWREHFYSMRRWFFTVRALYMAAVITASWLLLDISLTHPSRLFGVSHMILSLLGIATANERVHGILAIVTAILTLGAAYFIFFEATRWGTA